MHSCFENLNQDEGYFKNANPCILKFTKSATDHIIQKHFLPVSYKDHCSLWITLIIAHSKVQRLPRTEVTQGKMLFGLMNPG
ncbi:hypothetical protein TNIN_101421 [Trichonephila inaurata madagascariensis]|uniref:Uncharacterized protein n=1 Tax=Trichonephila inaurata madagascariensis TaxID=2747483 RepID=A0A8X6M8H0_9ARAC|nr:hypothetical protein TNIN_101421 [Trichonephila inaurata madagascariensis]